MIEIEPLDGIVADELEPDCACCHTHGEGRSIMPVTLVSLNKLNPTFLIGSFWELYAEITV
jgi:hypothetical protein